MDSIEKNLVMACRRGDLKDFQKFMNYCEYLNFVDNNGKNLLHCVVGRNPHSNCDNPGVDEARLEIMKFLINRGLDVNARDKGGDTPLHIAAYNGFQAGTKLLIEAGSDPNIRDYYRDSPLQMACRGMHQRVVRLVLERGPNRLVAGSPSIVKSQNERSLKLFLDKGMWSNIGSMFEEHRDSAKCMCSSDIKPKSFNKTSLLHIVNMYMDIKTKSMTDANGFVNMRHSDRLYSVQCTAHTSYIGVMGLLLDNGAIVDALCPKNANPLCTACHDANYDTVKLLLKRRANSIHRTNNRNTPMLNAITRGNIEIVRLLVDLAVELEKMEDERYFRGHFSPLSVAALLRQTEAFKYLLGRGLKVDYTEENGFSTIHFAARGGSYEIMKTILNFGVNVNISNEHCNTPLHVALRYNKPPNNEIIDLLLYFGADIEKEIQRGATILDRATREYRLESHDDDISTGQYNDNKLANNNALVIMHANRLKAAGLACTERSVESISLSNLFPYDYYDRCEKEIELMKTVSINDELTLYNFLCMSLRGSAKLIRNPIIDQTLLGMKPFKEFALYSSMLIFKYERAEQLKNLQIRGLEFFMSLNVTPKLSHDCVELVLRFVDVPNLLVLDKLLLLNQDKPRE